MPIVSNLGCKRWKNCDDMLSSFHLIPERNGQTDLLHEYRASVCWRAASVCWRAIKTKEMNDCCLFIMFSLKFWTVITVLIAINSLMRINFTALVFMPPPGQSRGWTENNASASQSGGQTGRQKHCFPFIHLSITKLVSIFWKGVNRFGCQ